MQCSFRISRSLNNLVLLVLFASLPSHVAASRQTLRARHVHVRAVDPIVLTNGTVGRTDAREFHCTISNTQPHLVPRGFECPAQCPFAQRIARDRCSKVCVPGLKCGDIHPARSYADPATMMCAATCGDAIEDRIQGCKVCAGPGKCKECATVLFGGFELSEDGKKCNPKAGLLWPIVYCCLGLAGLLILFYLSTMLCRPTINQSNMEAGLHHRGLCRPLRTDDTPYPLLSTNVHQTKISGIGVQLYFNWVRFMSILAFILFALSLTVFHTSTIADTTGRDIQHEDGDCESTAIDGDLSGNRQAEAAEKHNEKAIARYDEYNFRMFFAMLIASCLCTVLMLGYSYVQAHWAHEMRKTSHRPQRFAVYVHGLAQSETDPFPIKQFFEEFLRGSGALEGAEDGIVGVSICYDYFKEQSVVDEAVEHWIVEQDQALQTAEDDDPPTPRDRRGRFTYLLRTIDPYLFFLAPSGGQLENHQEEEERLKDISLRIRESLTTMTCSGQAYVICTNTKYARALASQRDFTYKDQVLQVHQVKIGPPEVNFWANTRESNFMNIVWGIGFLIATIALWVCMYLPYALDYIAYSSVPGRAPNFFEDLLLGLLIAIGNVIVANVIETIVPWWRMRGKDRRDRVVLSLGFLATLLNTIFDLWLVMEIAKGTEVDEAFEGKDTGYDRVLASELMVLIVPGYLVLPYVVTPLFEHILPYVSIKSISRTRHVAKRNVELGLEPPPFDIVWRYSDICNNFTICTTMLLFVTPNAWKVMGFLTMFAFLIYGIDFLKFLRFTSQTYYTTHRLSETFTMWFSIPMTCLCAVATWWGMKSGHVPEGLHLIPLIPAVYLVLYLFLLHLLMKRAKIVQGEADYSYQDLLKGMEEEGRYGDYFNCNPVFCLRQRWLGVKEPYGEGALVPFVPGKRYLQSGVKGKEP